MSTVDLKNVHKSYGSAKVLHGIDLNIADGEFVALVGPSGCGKSTLLRVIAGLEEISDGEVAIDGKVVNDIDPKGRNIAMVFQNYALYPHMTIRGNISLNLKISGLPKDEIEKRTLAAADLLDITEYLDRYPTQLSGGQKQRVAMGRAIVRDPAVFLFDEPLSNLDAKLRVQMRGEIKAFHEKVKATSLYVTHDQIEAMTLADRAVVINDGRIEQIGAPIELYERPQNLFVAGFIGSPAMNFFEGRVEQAANGDRAAVFDHERIALPPGLAVRDDETVIVGIRPERFVLSSDETGLAATVDHVEPTGPQTQLAVRCLGQDCLVIVNDYFQAKSSEQIRLKVSADKLHVFDAESGQRVAMAE